MTRPLLRRDEPAWGSRAPWLAGMLAAGWALVAGVAISTLPVVTVWFSEGAAEPVADPLRLGGDLWLLAHRTGVEVDGTTMRLAPLGLTLIVVLLLYRGARWAAHSADAGQSGAHGSMLLALAGSYALGAATIAGLVATSTVASVPLESFGMAALWALSAGCLGVVRECGVPSAVLHRLSGWARAVLAGGCVGTGVMVAGAAVLTTVSVVVHRSRIGELADAVGGGVIGGVVLLVASLVLVPNGIGWAWSFLVGPGFAIGTDTTVSPAGAELGLVPALPILGAVPEAVPTPLSWVVVGVPMVAGLVLAAVASRWLRAYDLELGMLRGALVGLGCAGMTGLAGALVAVLAGGSVGTARLSEVGADPLAVLLATTCWVGVPAALSLGWRCRASAS